MSEERNGSSRVPDCEVCEPPKGADAEIARRARALPDTLAPSRDLWPGIEARIGERASVLGHIGPAGETDREDPPSGFTGPSWGWALGFAIAAGLAGIIAGSLLVGPATQGEGPPLAGGSGAPGTSPPSLEAPAMPVSFAESQLREVEAAYEPEVQALRELVDSQELAPETREALGASLETIDRALEEAREALLADPGAPRALDALRGMYDAKIDLLHHVATRPGRT